MPSIGSVKDCAEAAGAEAGRGRAGLAFMGSGRASGWRAMLRSKRELDSERSHHGKVKPMVSDAAATGLTLPPWEA